jgi:hypothetical protein
MSSTLQRPVRICFTSSAWMCWFDFQTIYAEDLSFEQQVKICSRARHLVSNHGAGLTNMLFMPQGASVLATAPSHGLHQQLLLHSFLGPGSELFLSDVPVG